MCHFITGVIDKSTILEDLNQPGRENRISFHCCDNPFVKSQLGNHEVYLAKDCSYCDCDTQLGLLARQQSSEIFRVEKREMEKLQKKGWSEHKIERWLTDRVKNSEKGKRKDNDLANGPHADIANWILYLNKVFSDSRVNHLGLLLHWYKGGLGSEKIKIKERRKIRISELTEAILLKVNEDIIYDIVR